MNMNMNMCLVWHEHERVGHNHKPTIVMVSKAIFHSRLGPVVLNRAHTSRWHDMESRNLEKPKRRVDMHGKANTGSSKALERWYI
jgi:hypothetical protein